MKRVKCHSCGRVYDYQKDEICPDCGAYNRPPRHEVVEADGTVHLVDEKVCYEQKACFEEQARLPKEKRAERSAKAQRIAKPETIKKLLQDAKRLTGQKAIAAQAAEAEELPEELPTMTEQQAKVASGVIKFAGAKNKFGIVILGIIILSIAINYFQERRSSYEPEVDYSEEQTVEIETLREYRAMGDEIVVDDVPVVINSATFEEEKITVEVQIGIEEDYYFEPQLYWHDADGGEYWWWSDFSASAGNNTVRRYRFDISEPAEYGCAADEEGYYLVFYVTADEYTQVEYFVPLGSGNA